MTRTREVWAVDGYDPWQHVTTRSGLAADEVISGLQKAIRRGETEDAVAFAWEMHLSSAELEGLAWRRLMVISVEDIGFGDLDAPVRIEAMWRLRNEFDAGAPDRALFLVHAVRYLCSCVKDRSSDLLMNVIAREFEAGRVPVVRDHMLDMHTRRGQGLGRGLRHFLVEASSVEPLRPGAHDEYLPRLLALMDSEPAESPAQTGFPDQAADPDQPAPPPPDPA